MYIGVSYRRLLVILNFFTVHWLSLFAWYWRVEDERMGWINCCSEYITINFTQSSFLSKYFI